MAEEKAVEGAGGGGEALDQGGQGWAGDCYLVYGTVRHGSVCERQRESDKESV